MPRAPRDLDFSEPDPEEAEQHYDNSRDPSQHELPEYATVSKYADGPTATERQQVTLPYLAQFALFGAVTTAIMLPLSRWVFSGDTNPLGVLVAILAASTLIVINLFAAHQEEQGMWWVAAIAAFTLGVFAFWGWEFLGPLMGIVLLLPLWFVATQFAKVLTEHYGLVALAHPIPDPRVREKWKKLCRRQVSNEVYQDGVLGRALLRVREHRAIAVLPCLFTTIAFIFFYEHPQVGLLALTMGTLIGYILLLLTGHLTPHGITATWAALRDWIGSPFSIDQGVAFTPSTRVFTFASLVLLAYPTLAMLTDFFPLLQATGVAPGTATFLTTAALLVITPMLFVFLLIAPVTGPVARILHRQELRFAEEFARIPHDHKEVHQWEQGARIGQMLSEEPPPKKRKRAPEIDPEVYKAAYDAVRRITGEDIPEQPEERGPEGKEFETEADEWEEAARQAQDLGRGER